MTQVGHVITGAAIGILCMPKNGTTRQRLSHVAAFMLIATIPDWPFKNWGHDRYYLSHSLFVTLLFISLWFTTFFFSKALRKKLGDWPVIMGGSLAWLSHLLLDSFYNHGKGIAIYWPFSTARLALPIPWFDVGTGSIGHLMQVFLIEFISYSPLIVLALFIHRNWDGKHHPRLL
jgi:hypothetical protein